MLHYDVHQRATAAECLMNPWVTGEPLFANAADGLMYSEEMGYGNSNEHSPSAVQAGAAAVGFSFRPHVTGIESVLSATVGHRRNESDEEMSEDYDDIDEDDDEQSDGDESSQGDLDE